MSSAEPVAIIDIGSNSVRLVVYAGAPRVPAPIFNEKVLAGLGPADRGGHQPARAGNGYRDYSGDDIHRLAFLRRARNLGFSIDDCRQLMALYQDRSRASHDVREIAAAHVVAIEEKVRELQSMRSTLQKLIHACHGDDRPDCPILDDMSGVGG